MSITGINIEHELVSFASCSRSFVPGNNTPFRDIDHAVAEGPALVVRREAPTTLWEEADPFAGRPAFARPLFARPTPALARG